MKAEFPPEIIQMFLHSGRSDFRVTIQNVGRDGSMECFVHPIPSVAGYHPLKFTIEGAHEQAC
jgi:hypothetical protein